MTRIEKNLYYLGIAEAVSKRSTCLRRHYGAVIVRDDIIMATGYNGSARGEQNCSDVGKCYREERGIPHGERYELCNAVHAEMNAVIQAGFDKTRNSTLYLAGTDSDGNRIDAIPCKMCWRVIKNAGITKVVAMNDKDAPYDYDILFTDLDNLGGTSNGETN